MKQTAITLLKNDVLFKCNADANTILCRNLLKGLCRYDLIGLFSWYLDERLAEISQCVAENRH
jgi:hypothetical protein